MRPVERVLEVLDGEGGPNSKGEYLRFCPAHDDRNTPNLGVRKAEDGRALLICRAGCSQHLILAALEERGVHKRDLFEHNGRGGGGDLYPFETRATVQPYREMPRENRQNGVAGGDATADQPCNLKNYAAAKGLPVAFLERLGLSDMHYMEKPAVRIPYRSPDGSEVVVRFRTALEKSEESADDRFRWRSGSKAMLYGLERLEKIREVGYVVLVEGESDAQTLWHHRLPALGVPGASNWKPRWAEYLEGIARIYAVIEPDRGGETLQEKLGTSGIGDRLYLVELGKHKDPSGLYLADRENFKDRFAAALEDAKSWSELERAQIEEASRAAWEVCRRLATVPNILDLFADDLARSGVAGESRVAKLLYLAVTSRLLDKPVSVAVKGPSSGGKSYLTEQVLRFFPESAYYALTAMSEHALAYSDEPLSHRFLVLYEASGMDSDFQTYLLRSLLSEGKVRYETVEKTSEGMKPRLIEREGPTGLIVTTTAVKLHPENETRLLSLTVTDTQDQTRAVMSALANEATGDGPDLEEWRALQVFLEGTERRVTVPYARELAGLIPPVAVRLRRDFGAILNLIRAHAVLHQASRERDEEGRIVATVEDYTRVRELVANLVSEGVEATVPATTRKTVETLKELSGDEEDHVTIAALAEELKLDKSAAWRRVRSAMERGYIKNLEDRKGRPARLVPGDDVPDDIEVLPDPGQLETTPLSHGCTVAGDFEGIHHPPPSSAAEKRERFTI